MTYRSLMNDEERRVARGLAALSYVNPFLPERVEREREVLGGDFIDSGEVWHARTDDVHHNPNLHVLTRVAEDLARRLRGRLEKGAGASGAQEGADDRDLYREVVYYLLYHRWERTFFEAIVASPGRQGRFVFPSYDRFQDQHERFLRPLAGSDGALPGPSAPHLFACFFQIRRAFHYTFRFILGASMPAARLRAEVWQSVFTHDLRRFQRSLFRVMGDVTTLITGPSGTGKELVARAIGLSRHIPFDAGERAFQEDYEESFYPLNLSALSPTLIESELFGHRRGAFTGAVESRAGWLEVCPPLGTVFLDEIGEIGADIQVKLLRVLESRSFQRLGESRPRSFTGKLTAATNRDLGREMARGEFREDLYYRLCADTVRTPSLAERLRSGTGELEHLTAFLARQVVGEAEGEAEAVASEVIAWIDAHLGPDYPWPGNVRELAQCVRNVMIRRTYRPVVPAADEKRSPIAELSRDMEGCDLTADEVQSRYITWVYAQSGSYQEAARRLGLDRRTVKARLDTEFLERCAAGSG